MRKAKAVCSELTMAAKPATITSFLTERDTLERTRKGRLQVWPDQGFWQLTRSRDAK
jgi:hypothetical protein